MPQLVLMKPYQSSSLHKVSITPYKMNHKFILKSPPIQHLWCQAKPTICKQYFSQNVNIPNLLVFNIQQYCEHLGTETKREGNFSVSQFSLEHCIVTSRNPPRLHHRASDLPSLNINFMFATNTKLFDQVQILGLEKTTFYSAKYK